MQDYLNIGCTPYEEPCAQVGSENYTKRSAVECRVFAAQCKRVLKKKYGSNYDVEITVKSFSHDFGTYREVVVLYDTDNEQQVQQALYLESADLSQWDKEAKEELATYSRLLES